MGDMQRKWKRGDLVTVVTVNKGLPKYATDDLSGEKKGEVAPIVPLTS